MKRCLYQVFRPDYGNCMVCTYDEHNKHCERYTPITLTVFEVVEKKEEGTLEKKIKDEQI